MDRFFFVIPKHGGVAATTTTAVHAIKVYKINVRVRSVLVSHAVLHPGADENQVGIRVLGFNLTLLLAQLSSEL